MKLLAKKEANAIQKREIVKLVQKGMKIAKRIDDMVLKYNRLEKQLSEKYQELAGTKKDEILELEETKRQLEREIENLTKKHGINLHRG